MQTSMQNDLARKSPCYAITWDLVLLTMLFDATGELSVIVLSWVLYLCLL